MNSQTTDPQSATSTKASAPSILLVEDNELTHFVMRKMFESYNVSLKIVISGQEAVENLAEQHYDMILMDMMLPDMHGLHCIKKIRSLREEDDFNIVAFTAFLSKEAKEELTSYQVEDCLYKPVQPEELDDLLRKHAIVK